MPKDTEELIKTYTHAISVLKKVNEAGEELKEINPYASGMGNVVDYNRGIRAGIPVVAKLKGELSNIKHIADNIDEFGHPIQADSQLTDFAERIYGQFAEAYEEIARLKKENEELRDERRYKPYDDCTTKCLVIVEAMRLKARLDEILKRVDEGEIKKEVSNTLLPIVRKRIIGQMSGDKLKEHQDWNSGYEACEEDFLETNYKILAQAISKHIKEGK